ncbi:MAG TPA: type IV pilus secretin PilQ [Vicinamibacterales bacterium]|nr:type IV pilus secretin PilQ [Vicinamibacterales bacterium]
MRHNWTLRTTAGRGRAHPAAGRAAAVVGGLAIVLACHVGLRGFVPAEGDAPRVRVSAISAVTGPAGTSVRIEASEPVAYSAVRPDPMTVLVELRHATTAGAVNKLGAAVGAVAGATLEDSTASDGAPVARVRLLLNGPAVHRVHSNRNVIQVDVAGQGTASPQAMSVPAPPTTTAPSPAPPQAPGGKGPAPAAPAAAAPAPTPEAARSVPPPMAVPNSIGGQAQPVAAGRQYTGHPISLDFQGADLRSVLRTFSEVSALNMVIDPAVQGSVDVALRDVPWDQALDIILRANKLGYVVDGTVVRIAPLSVLADEEGQRRKLSEEQALSGELRVVTHALSYAKAEDLQDLLVRSALSKRGDVQFDPRTNTLIIRDLPASLETAQGLLEALDRPQPQVEIEARIVQTTRDFARSVGVQWGVTGRVSDQIGNTTNLAFPNKGSLTGRTGGVQGGTDGSLTQQAVNLGVAAATSAVGLTLGSVNGAFNLDVALSALEKSGRGRVLSSPRVSTQNNQPAEMTQGTQIPIQTIANNTVTVTFKDAALTLKVTPQITASNTVIMNISLENASPDYTRAVGPSAIPPIDTQRAITTVLVRDGETTVIGGIEVSREQAQTDRTPGLGRIPLLKWLFKRDSVQDENRELLIFITPRIAKL